MSTPIMSIAMVFIEKHGIAGITLYSFLPFGVMYPLDVTGQLLLVPELSVAFGTRYFFSYNLQPLGTGANFHVGSQSTLV